jgi:DNA-directed RNA polymerase specialized sigma24 family protein
LAGNQSAYADLVKRHQRFVFTLALRFAKGREDAEEVAQDCFIKAYRSLSRAFSNNQIQYMAVQYCLYHRHDVFA